MGRRARMGGEEGIALPVAILVLGLTLAITAYAFAAATRSNDQSNADRRVKLALQAADAGLQTALYRLNKFDAARSTQPCVVVAPGSTDNELAYGAVDPALPSWCPAVTETLSDGASWSYRVSARSAASTERTLVSTGNVGSTTRRVATTVTAAGGTTSTSTPLFGAYVVTSNDVLNLDNGVRVTGSARSNENITLSGGASICGDAIPGPGRTVAISNGASVCGSRTPATAPFTLAPVNQGTAATDNSNSRICGLDPCTGHTYNNGAFTWDAAARRLRVAGDATVTLGGAKPYSFCRLELDAGGKIIVPVGQTLKIFIDAPENCGGTGGTLTKIGDGRFMNLGGDPSMLQIYVAGSATIATPVIIAGRSERFTVYAPLSEVSVTDGDVTGAIAAKRVLLAGGAVVTGSASTASVTAGASVFSLFAASAYRECVGVASSTAVDRGCAVNLTG